MTTSLGERLKSLRNSKGYTLEGLSDITSVSKSYIWELENKNPPRPSADRLLALSRPLKVTLEYLMYGETEEVTQEGSEDDMFFRKYKKMDAPTKQKLQQMIELIWDDDGD